ncbi:glycerophosphodiester phosphodiesterase family protein [Microbacterium paulum]
MTAPTPREPHPWFRGVRKPRVLAHRGFVPRRKADGADADHAEIVENTLAAFAAAHAAGAPYVESDCHLTADGVVVLFHDDDLTRISGDPRKVADVTHADLARIMEDRGGLMTAAEALEAFPDLRFNLDVKAAAAALPLGRIVAPHADRVLLTSFSDRRRREALEAARTAGGFPATSAGQATVARALVASRLGRAALSRAVAGIDALQVPERVGVLRVVTRRFVRAVHAVGVEVHVWTVNDADAMRRLLDLGVDGLVTDRADVAIAVASGRPH